MRVLIVEDDFTSRLLLQQLLAPYGESHVAVNGREALEAFKAAIQKKQPYDLICLDIMMPEMDGQQALKEIRRLEEEAGAQPECKVKILMTTALMDAKNVLTAFYELCDGYLMKPIDKAKLMKSLNEFGLVNDNG